MTNHAAVSTVAADEADKMYQEFCSSAGKFHYSKHSSVRNSIDFGGTRDFSVRCNVLNTRRSSAVGRGIACVGNTKILNEREDFVEVTSRKRIQITDNKGTCGSVKTYKIDESDYKNYETFENSVFTIVSLW